MIALLMVFSLVFSAQECLAQSGEQTLTHVLGEFEKAQVHLNADRKNEAIIIFLREADGAAWLKGKAMSEAAKAAAVLRRNDSDLNDIAIYILDRLAVHYFSELAESMSLPPNLRNLSKLHGRLYYPVMGVEGCRTFKDALFLAVGSEGVGQKSGE